MKPRERDSPSISLVGSVASPFSVQNQHPTKWHCEECGVPLPQYSGKPSAWKKKQDGKPILCIKCARSKNIQRYIQKCRKMKAHFLKRIGEQKT